MNPQPNPLKAVANFVALAMVFPAAATCGLEDRLHPGGEGVFVFWTHVFALLPGHPGLFLRRAFYRLTLEHCSLHSVIGFGTLFSHRQVRVEDNVFIGPYAVVGCAHLGAGCLIGTRANLLSGSLQHELDENGRWSPSDRTRFMVIEIGRNSWIGEASTVMADVGEGSMVSAGAVVSAPVASHVVVAGNPARFVREVRPAASPSAEKREAATTSSEMSYKPFIDWMKCLGMLVIVYGHLAGWAPLASLPPIYSKQIGVALFLFATGYSLSRETRARWQVAFNRLFEVYLFGLACALVVTVVSYETRHRLQLSNYEPFVGGVNVLVNNFPANPTTWYLGTYLHVIVLWAVFVPLGAFLAVATETVPVSIAARPILRRMVFLALIATAVGIELGKVLVPSRIADLTNVILAVMGGCGGMIVATRLFGVVDRRSAPALAPRGVERPFSHIAGLDGLRAIACVAVFGVHFHQLTGVQGHVGPFELSRAFENGNHGVALFFILSGFLLGLPFWFGREPAFLRGGLKRYAFKRAGRILPAYFVCLTILVLGHRHWQNPLERLDTLLHYVFLHNYTEVSFYGLSSPFWTLAVQMQFYLIYPLALWLVLKVARTRKAAFYTWLGFLLASATIHWGLMSYAARISAWPLDSRWLRQDGFVLSHSLVAHLPLFFLGVCSGYVFWLLSKRAARQELSLQTFCESAFWISACAMLAMLTTPLDDVLTTPFARYHFPFAPFLIVTCIVCVPYTRVARQVLEAKPLRALGTISFGFYVYHLACLNGVARAMSFVGESPSANPWTLALVGLAVSMSVAAVSYPLIERPLLRVSKGRVRRRRTTEVGESKNLTVSAAMVS